MSGFLFLQQKIQDRLRASLDLAGQQSVRVLSAPDLSDIATLPVPCVIVIFDGYSIAESASMGKSARINQTWLAVVAVRSASNIKAGDASRAQAGDIADTVLSSVMGFTAAGCSKPMSLTNPPKAAYEDGFFYLPVAIEAEIYRKST